MYRYAMEKLFKWKHKTDRKPLMIEGARQVGKTWLAREFGAMSYTETVYINLSTAPQITALFAGELRVERLIMGLELYAGHKLAPESTLLIFDEAQEAPGVFAGMEVFGKNAPQYHIICICDQLVSGRRGFLSPGSCIEVMRLYPLNFREFLTATGKKRLADQLEKGDYSAVAEGSACADALKHYLFVGGMPEAVQSFSVSRDFNRVREIQNRILAAYGQDVSRTAPHGTVPKIRMVLNAVPAQLAKENKKFVYGLIREGGRASEFGSAIRWLTESGLVQKVVRIEGPEKPLKIKGEKAFKLFFVDVGLLGCMLGFRQRVLLDGNAVFTAFSGALTQQYAVQQISAGPGTGVYYYANSRGSGEVDLVIDTGEAMIPVEVTATVNLQAKSLKTYREKFAPPLAVRASLGAYREEDGLVDLPLCAAENIPRRLPEKTR